MARVLIVDDDEITRLVLGSMLEDNGHEVTYASDGEAALRRFKIGRFDVVITDLAMPEKNGFLLIQDLQGEDWKLPLIAMSGLNAEHLTLAEDMGAKAILYKPLEREKVLSVLNRVLQESQENPWDMVRR